MDVALAANGFHSSALSVATPARAGRVLCHPNGQQENAECNGRHSCSKMPQSYESGKWLAVCKDSRTPRSQKYHSAPITVILDYWSSDSNVSITWKAILQVIQFIKPDKRYVNFVNNVTITLSDEEITKIKVLDLDELLNFVVDDFFS
uniref:Uncharacterized protein n=1 Tax=Oryza sativa subsp. japonica TaxID=39947 RepID=Q6Z7M5_ORYSJ|nr:hypothetical protein [Oryza sativa Japonica Group]